MCYKMKCKQVQMRDSTGYPPILCHRVIKSYLELNISDQTPGIATTLHGAEEANSMLVMVALTLSCPPAQDQVQTASQV